MNFLLDENFPKSAEELLHGSGHKVIDIRAQTNKEQMIFNFLRLPNSMKRFCSLPIGIFITLFR